MLGPTAPRADTLVTYVNTPRRGGPGTAYPESGVAAQRTDAAGRFAFRYVARTPCGGPFRLETRDPDTGARARREGYVRVDGQRLSLDLVLIGHGHVTGTVSHADGRARPPAHASAS